MRKLLSHLSVVLVASLLGSVTASAAPTELYRFTGKSTNELLGNGLACIGRFGTASQTSDVAVGSPGSASGLGNTTAFLGSDGSTTLFNLNGSNVASEFGFAIARIGDVNGDNLEDVAIGSPGIPTAQIFLSPDGQSSIPLNNDDVDGGSRYGASIAGLFSDLDRDGVNDVIVGAPLAIGFQGPQAGYVAVQDGRTGTTIVSLEGIGSGIRLGTAVESIEDRDADSIRDLLVSAPGVNNGIGAVVIESSATGTPLLTINGNAGPSAGFGASLAVVPDVNSDGIADILVGAPNASGNDGEASLFSGTTGATLCTIRGTTNARLGTAVAAIGDQDGGGTQDFAIGSPGAAGGRGTVTIFTFANSTCTLLYTLAGTTANERFGTTLTGISGGLRSCDVNGDSFPDFGVGSRDETGAPDGGGAVFFAGNPDPTPTPTATPTATATPRLPTSARFDYRISLNGTFKGKNVMNRDPAGRCRVTLLGRRTSSNRKNRGPIVTVESRKLAQEETTMFSGGPLSKPLSEAPGRPYLFHMLVKNECSGGKVFYSNVFSRRLTCGAMPAITERQWERELPKKVH